MNRTTTARSRKQAALELIADEASILGAAKLIAELLATGPDGEWAPGLYLDTVIRHATYSAVRSYPGEDVPEDEALAAERQDDDDRSIRCGCRIHARPMRSVGRFSNPSARCGHAL